MPKPLAIVLSDGGLNAAVAAAVADRTHRLVLLHAEVGGRGARRRAAFDGQARHFKPHREQAVAMPFLAPLRRSDAASGEAVEPWRAGLIDLLPLVGVAARFAAHHGATAIFTGQRAGPHADPLAGSAEFSQLWGELLQLPVGLRGLSVETPLVELEPWQVVDLGVRLGAPLADTWSCESDGPTPCGGCAGCRQRDAAFQRAARADPVK